MHYVTQGYKYIVEEVFLMINQEVLQKMKEDKDYLIVKKCNENVI